MLLFVHVRYRVRIEGTKNDKIFGTFLSELHVQGCSRAVFLTQHAMTLWSKIHVCAYNSVREHCFAVSKCTVLIIVTHGETRKVVCKRLHLFASLTQQRPRYHVTWNELTLLLTVFTINHCLCVLICLESVIWMLIKSQRIKRKGKLYIL
jgi:hypothetical protein